MASGRCGTLSSSWQGRGRAIRGKSWEIHPLISQKKHIYIYVYIYVYIYICICVYIYICILYIYINGYIKCVVSMVNVILNPHIYPPYFVVFISAHAGGKKENGPRLDYLD